MDSITIVFFALALLITVSAFFVVGSRNIFHSAIFLVLGLFGVAGIFVLLEAPFLAAAQVLIYVGAVSILMIFAIMLTARIGDTDVRYTNEQVPTGLAVSAGLLIIILYSLWQTPIATVATSPGPGSGKKLGELFLTQFVLPFEVVSVLLLAALIGALIIARRDRSGSSTGPSQPLSGEPSA
jgi:NADH:ubiquinone oxidoreductase subunit 6 (subunit J)